MHNRIQTNKNNAHEKVNDIACIGSFFILLFWAEQENRAKGYGIWF